MYDLKHYKINNWKKIVSGEFRIVETKLPALYPYPDYLQLFKMKKRKYYYRGVALKPGLIGYKAIDRAYFWLRKHHPSLFKNNYTFSIFEAGYNAGKRSVRN